LQTLYQVEEAPCDTYLRERLDELEPKHLTRAYKSGLRAVQRSKLLPLFEFEDGYFLVSQDGTGVFHSENVHCQHCCEKHHRDGRITYYHQIMGAVLVHPDQSVVLPLMSEPILQQDGSNKNDCERNADKRLLETLRQMHPKLKMVVVEDALHSNAPHLSTLSALHYRYLIGVKPKSHRWLFDWVAASKGETHEMTRDDKTYRFRWVNDAPLNESHEELRVNFLECWETDKQGKQQHFTWITDFVIKQSTVYQLMRGARARWKIENETFNTLKTQGYHFEHNFGHGNQHLNTVFSHLMMLAFLIDQIQQLGCPLFQRALQKCHSRKLLWERMRSLFWNFFVESWDVLYQAIIDRPKFYLQADTS
jgi:hypothetical protein